MKRALIVGINDYLKKPLKGCVPDANKMHKVLAYHGDGTRNFDCRIITSSCSMVSRPVLLGALQQLLNTYAESVIFYFSGHGSRHVLGGYLITQDAQVASDGLAFRDLQTLIMRSPVKEITIILDCCYSGLFGDDEGNSIAELREGVSIMTASQPEETSMEDANGGIFTSLVVDALNDEAADIMGNITLASVYSYVDGLLSAWDQRPMYKMHASHLHPLRHGTPKIDPNVLRNLDRYFPSIDFEIQLSADNVPSEGKGNSELQIMFKDLQALRCVNIVEPTRPHIHLYYAAMEEGRCKLTPQGRFYWRMVQRNMI